MAYLEEITHYKEELMKTFCTTEPIVEMLRLSGETLSGVDMRYKRIFPFEYVPDTTQVAQPFLCFQVEAPLVLNGAIKKIVLSIYAIQHQSLMRTDKGVWNDVMLSEVDHLLNGNTNYGIGKVELQSHKTIAMPSQGYHGKISIYYAKDFNRLCGAI